ncbi:TM2 domain-containing protein [Tomitella fengzijianii]|uniref:NINE protein n=1 Tax=Tomitella fengzijianii TaxID=2597660 RepID=A0A516X421_9ACTN|nr:TM2 domain-containing protein [Tomitella fengzijianii]QDQ97818.1 NINE protein [Tomitella fengzijianii]
MTDTGPQDRSDDDTPGVSGNRGSGGGYGDADPASGDTADLDSLGRRGSPYDDTAFGQESVDSGGPESGGSASGYDADEAWTIRKESPGPGWTTQAGAGSGPGWGSAPLYESDATPFGTSYGETARYEADAVEAAESAPVDPEADDVEPDYSDPIADDAPRHDADAGAEGPGPGTPPPGMPPPPPGMPPPPPGGEYGPAGYGAPGYAPPGYGPAGYGAPGYGPAGYGPGPGMWAPDPTAPYGRHPVTGEAFSDKQKLVAGLLQIFVGWTGAGRFYLGDNGMGVAQLLVSVFTCGIGALWPLIDGILILMGNVRDSQGRPLRD